MIFQPISANNYVTFKPNLYLCWSLPLKVATSIRSLPLKIFLSFKFVFHGSLSSVKGRLSSCKGWSHKSTISSYQWWFNGINSFWPEWIFHQHDLSSALNFVWHVWVPLPIPCIPHIHHGLLELHCGSWAGIPKNLTISAKWKYLKYQKYND